MRYALKLSFYLFVFVIITAISARLFAASSDPPLRRVMLTSSFGFDVRDKSGSMSTEFMLSVQPERAAPFIVQTKTAEPGSPQRISQATIWINNVKVIQTSDFDNGVSNVTRQIKLNTDNIIRAEVSGPINSGLWALFTGALDTEHGQVFRGDYWLTEDGQDATIKKFSAHPYVKAPFEVIVMRPWLNNRTQLYPPATIILNGQIILSPSDMQQKYPTILTREVDLLAENTLELQNPKGPRAHMMSIFFRGKRAPGFPGPASPSMPESKR